MLQNNSHPEIDRTLDFYTDEYGTGFYNYLSIGDEIYMHPDIDGLATIIDLKRNSNGVVVKIKPDNNHDRDRIHLSYESVEGLLISRNNIRGWYKFRS